MKEVWKDIKNTDGFYEASNLGRIRTWKKKCGGSEVSTKPMIMSLNNKKT